MRLQKFHVNRTMTKFSLDVLKDEKAPAIALVAVVVRKYGMEASEWQPEFLRDELKSDFGVEISDLQSDKIQAGFTILTTDAFQSQWEVFKTVCHLLNNTSDSFDDPTPLEAEELASALAHYKLFVDDGDDMPPFSDEVKAYIGVVLYHYGMSEPALIFKDALMPHSVKADPSEKNAALGEIYDVRTKGIVDYTMSLLQE